MLKWAWYGWRLVSSSDGGLLQERHAELVRAGRHRDADLQVLVDGRDGPCRPAAA